MCNIPTVYARVRSSFPFGKSDAFTVSFVTRATPAVARDGVREIFVSNAIGRVVVVSLCIGAIGGQ